MTPRCKQYRRRILDISQKVSALHIGGAFSCIEIVDCIYNDLMYHGNDIFIMSKGHAGIAQYVVLEDRGLLSLDDYAKGTLGVHPDCKTPGVEASTGSLGHGLGLAIGIALAEPSLTVFVLISDGELQEGSTWEAAMLAPKNVVMFVDNNDFQSATRTSNTHPNVYPIELKFRLFGWEVMSVNGHDTTALISAVNGRSCEKPTVVVAKTTKGYGVSFMAGVPQWHYRSPSPAEYELACKELAA